MAGHDADVIIVGAGTAGCVVARRLAESGVGSLLLDAGPATSPDSAATAGPLAGLSQADRQWPVSDSLGRYVRGRGLGGGSAINGMVMMAGDTADLRQFGGAALVQEMLRVVDELAPSPRPHGVLAGAFRSAARALGHRSSPSSAELDQEGLLTMALALDAAGRRSVAEVYLGQLENGATRSATGVDIEVVGGTEVIGLLRDGPAVAGVRAVQRRRDGSMNQIDLTARHVVLSMGALASPRLLLNEGLGNDHVGTGLKDHPAVPLTIEMSHHVGDEPITTGLRWSSALGNGDLLALPMESIGNTEHPRGLVLTMALRVSSAGRVAADGVRFEHLSHPDDRLRMRAALRDVTDLLREADLESRCAIDDLGSPLTELPTTDADLDQWIAGHLGGVFHAGCSCRFGAAVGPGGLLLGERGISVVDASVMSDLPAGNPQLAVMAWASWMADQLATHLSDQRPMA